MPAIPALYRLKQEHCSESEASLGWVASIPCLKINQSIKSLVIEICV